MSQLLEGLFPKGTVVAYCPGYNDENGFPVEEIGVVSSCGDAIVFVKFKRELDFVDGEWDAVTAKGCKPDQLKIIIQGETHEGMAPKQEG